MKSLRLMAATFTFILALTFSVHAQSGGQSHTGGYVPPPPPPPITEKTTDADAADADETDGFWTAMLIQLTSLL